MRIFLALLFILCAPGFLVAQGSLGDMARQNRSAVNIATGSVGMMTVGTTGSTAFRSTGTTAVSISVGTNSLVNLNWQAEFGGGATVFGTGGRFNNFRITDVATPLTATGIAGFRKAGTEGFTLEPFATDGGIYLGVDKASFLGFGDGAGGVRGLLRATGSGAFSLRGANDVTLADLTLGALNATGTGTISQLTLANGTSANATFQLSSTGTLTIDPSGATHRVYIPGEFYTDFAQITTLGDDLPSLRLDHVTLETGNAAEFTAPALTTGNIVLMSATGTGSGTASALRLVNTRSGSGTNVGLTINATGAGAKSIDVESGAINLGSGVTIGTGTAAFTVPTANGTSGQLLTFNGSGGTSWTTVSGGTGGGLTMGGTSGQVLYNNAGAIGSVPGLTVTGTAVTATGMTLASGTTQLLGSLLVGSGTAGTVITGTSTGISIQSPIGNTNPDLNPLFRIYAGKYSRNVMNVTETGSVSFSQAVDLGGTALQLHSAAGQSISGTQWTMNNATTGIGYSGATGLVEVNNGTQGTLRDLRLRNVQTGNRHREQPQQRRLCH
jgi:hypothetical protein